MSAIFTVASCANPADKATPRLATLTPETAKSTEALSLTDRVVVFTDLDRTMVSSDVQVTGWHGPFPMVHGYRVGQTLIGRLVLSDQPTLAHYHPVVPLSFIEMLKNSYERDSDFHFVVVTQNTDAAAAYDLALLVLEKARVPRSVLKEIKFRDETGEYDKSSFMQNYLRSVGGRPEAIFFDDQLRNIVQANALSSAPGRFPILAVHVDPHNPEAAFNSAEVQERLRVGPIAQPRKDILDASGDSIATRLGRSAPKFPPLVSSIKHRLSDVPSVEHLDDQEGASNLPRLTASRVTVTGAEARRSFHHTGRATKRSSTRLFTAERRR